MNRQFYEFWASFFTNAAQGQKQFEDVSALFKQGASGWNEMTQLFMRSYGLKPPQSAAGTHSPEWQKAIADFDEAHVGLRGGLYGVRAHADFEASADGHAEGRRHHGHVGVLEGHVRALELPNHEVQLLPLLLLGGEENEHEVGAGAEVLALVADHQRVEVLPGLFHRRPQHGDGVGAEGVHLGVELHEAAAVAQVDERRAGVLLLQAAGSLDRGEVKHPGTVRDWLDRERQLPVEEALRIMPEMAGLGIQSFEQPIAAEDLDPLRGHVSPRRVGTPARWQAVWA